MPDDNDNLSSIADYYASQGMSNPQLSYDQNGNPIFQSNKLPVDISNLKDYAATLPVPTPNPLPTHETWINPIAKGSLTDALTGLGGGERYQLFPERIVRSALSLPTDVMSGKVQTPVSGGNKVLSSDEDSEDELLQRVQDMAALMGGGGVASVTKAGGNIAKDTLGVVPVGAAKRMNVEPSVPSDTLKAAVENTPGAAIDPDGALRLTVSRRQRPEQEGEESVRGGVFYLPKGSKDQRYYSGTKENFSYGGSQKIEGETAYLNPLVVKGATGGKAPQTAYDQLQGKGAYEEMRKEALRSTGPYYLKYDDKVELAKQFLEKYAPDMQGQEYNIIRNSTKGNQLPYALQEAAVASAARKAGHDGIIGYSTKKDGTPFLSEIFDVRESHYPTTDGDYTVHSHYLRSDNEAAAPIAALEKAPVFHSAVENAVNTASLKSAPPQQWLSTIANAKGVKPEELDWTGLKDFLQEQKGPVSKEQIQQHLEGNKVELKEVNKGVLSDKQLNDAAKQKYNKDYEELGPFQQRSILNDIQESGIGGEPKHSKWQLPGGENYREKLLTLPEKPVNFGIFKDENQISPNFNDAREARQWAIDNGHLGGATVRQTNEVHDYKSSHWDEPNVLAHIRMNDRFIPDENGPSIKQRNGNQVVKYNPKIHQNEERGYWHLHGEEFQSDMHQQGREQGYKITDAQKKELESIDNKLTSKLSEGDIGNPDMDAVLKTAVEKKVITSQEAANYKQWSKGENSNIPDAPFKKTWLDLALKRFIREAAEGGYDRVSWTPGEAQAARYPDELRRVVSSIGWGPPDRAGLKYVHAVPKEGGKHMVFTVNPEGKVVEASSPQAKGKGLDELFGKDMAKQIMEQKEGDIDGKDFVMGGKFLMDLYNIKLPQILQKLTGQKMKVSNVDQPGGIGQWSYKGPNRSVDDIIKIARNAPSVSIEHQLGDIANAMKDGNDFGTAVEMHGSYHAAKMLGGELTPVKKPVPINYIDLPQSVKDIALHKGFPLFSSGLMLSPVEDNPFAKSKYKLVPVDHNPFKEKK